MTNKPLTPQEIIGRLATEYCKCHPEKGDNPRLSHLSAVYIGDVLKRIFMDKKGLIWVDSPGYSKLGKLWGKCGIHKSLQEIEEESGYEDYLHPVPFNTRLALPGEELMPPRFITYTERKLKSPQARELFNFLAEIL